MSCLGAEWRSLQSCKQHSSQSDTLSLHWSGPSWTIIFLSEYHLTWSLTGVLPCVGFFFLFTFCSRVALEKPTIFCIISNCNILTKLMDALIFNVYQEFFRRENKSETFVSAACEIHRLQIHTYILWMFITLFFLCTKPVNMSKCQSSCFLGDSQTLKQGDERDVHNVLCAAMCLRGLFMASMTTVRLTKVRWPKGYCWSKQTSAKDHRNDTGRSDFMPFT